MLHMQNMYYLRDFKLYNKRDFLLHCNRIIEHELVEQKNTLMHT